MHDPWRSSAWERHQDVKLVLYDRARCRYVKEHMRDLAHLLLSGSAWILAKRLLPRQASPFRKVAMRETGGRVLCYDSSQSQFPVYAFLNEVYGTISRCNTVFRPCFALSEGYEIPVAKYGVRFRNLFIGQYSRTIGQTNCTFWSTNSPLAMRTFPHAENKNTTY
jgi:hypothetical protein